VRDGAVIASLPVNDEAGVAIDGHMIGPKGIVNFKPGKPIKIKVTFARGAFVDIATYPVQLSIVDVLESANDHDIILTGRGAQPLGQVRIIQSPSIGFWSATGYETETFWQLSLSREAPTVRVTGSFGIPFTFLFQFDRLPRGTDRVYVDRTHSSGTYLSSTKVYGFAGVGKKVTTPEQRAVMRDTDRFEWTFPALKQGQDNRARLRVRSTQQGDRDKQWVASHTLFRGYPYEASGRLTGVFTDSSRAVGVVELAGSAWFETVFKSESPLFSKQRWGTSARYFRALSAINLTPTKSLSEFSTLTADLRYNFLPGLWNRDELVGAIVAAESVVLGPYEANLLGAGAYWARTMPKFFDDIFNLVSFLRYPKYVDMEFIMFPVILTSGLTGTMNYNLNFHGKVFWTKRLYGEAGFGAKSFDFVRSSANSISFESIYGTFGIGMIF
jgi:hypothetical protein